MEADLAVGLAPDEADRQTSAEFAACCLIANAAVEAGPQYMQLSLAHGALEPKQETVVEQGRMIDAVGIADQCVGEAGKVDEAGANRHYCERAVTPRGRARDRRGQAQLRR